jgi:hypothetical protein
VQTDAFRRWLEGRRYASTTVSDYMSEARRVEAHYGDLDDHFSRDRLSEVLFAMRYSTEDERERMANPTPLMIAGNLRTNLAAYRSACLRYVEFRDATA